MTSFLGLMFLGCAYPYGRENYKDLPFEKLQLGMTQQQVSAALGRGPSEWVGSRRQADDVVDVWYYMKAYFNWFGGQDHIQEEYWLYFLNGKLEKWSNLGDWEREADRILEIRLKE